MVSERAPLLKSRHASTADDDNNTRNPTPSDVRQDRQACAIDPKPTYDPDQIGFSHNTMSRPVYEAMLRAGPVPVLVFVTALGMTLFETSRVPALEAAICGGSGMSMGDCRRDRSARERLANVNGWIDFVTSLQVILLMLPYAWIAEKTSKYGLLLVGVTASIASMAYFYFFCRFVASSPSAAQSLDLVILFRTFECIGGGLPVAQVLLTSILVRHTTDETRVSVFFLNSALLVLGRAGGAAISGAILDRDVNAAILAAIGVYGINIPVIAFSVGWQRDKHNRDDTSCSKVTHNRAHDPVDDDGLSTTTTTITTTIGNGGHGDVTHVLQPTRGSGGVDDHAADDEPETNEDHLPPKPLHRESPIVLYTHLIRQPVVARGLLFYVVKVLSTDVQLIQPQWLVWRFDWTFSAAAYVNAGVAVLCLAVLAGLPKLSATLLDRFGGDSRRVEITVLRLSLAAFVLGSLAIGLAPSRAAYVTAFGFSALSVGSFDAFKSFLGGLCATETVTELFATVSLVETAVHIAASRLWPAVLVASFDLQGSLKGLPYLLSCVLGLVAFCLIWYMERGATERYKPLSPGTES